jgi:hypothetical protein
VERGKGGTYVVKRTTVVGELDYLDTGIEALSDIEALGQGDMWEAEGTVAGLVEGPNKGLVQASHVVAEADVDIGLGGCVGGLEDEGAAVERPEGAVGVGDGLVNATA